MNETQHDEDRHLLESIVQSIAKQAIQIRPSERYDFIIRQVHLVSLAYEEKYGLHPDPDERDFKLHEWARALVDILGADEGGAELT